MKSLKVLDFLITIKAFSISNTRPRLAKKLFSYLDLNFVDSEVKSIITINEVDTSVRSSRNDLTF